MATFAPGGAQRYEQHSIQNINDDVYEKCHDVIIARTGMQALSYEHLYGFKKHVDKFIHQNPQGDFNRRNRATPLGLGSDRIPEQLDGWENISDEQKDTYHQIFNRYSTDEMQIAFDRFFQRQGRRPFVDEFSRYLLILEGNDHHDTSRKTLGNLFLESEELKHVVEDDAKVIESLGEMMKSKDVMNNTLSEAYSDLLAERENLKIDRDNYQAVLSILHGERTKLEEDKNMLTMDLSLERNKIDDLRGEKIRLDESCKELYSQNVHLQSQNVQLESQNVQLESQNVQLEKDISDARSEIALVEAKLEKLDDTVVVFTSLLENVEKKLSEAEYNVESLLNENGSLKDKLTDVTDDNQKLSDDNQKLSDDKFRLQQTLDTMTDDNQKLSDDKFRLQQTLDTMTDDNQKLSDDKFRLQQTLDTVTDDNQKLSDDNQKLSDDNQKLSDDNQKLSDDKFILQQTLDTVTDDNQKLSDDNQKLSDDNQKLSDDKFRIQQTLDTVTDDNQKLSDDNQKLSDDKFRIQQTLDTVTDDNQKLSDDNQKLSDDKFRLQQTLDTVTDDKFRLQQTLDTVTDDNFRLQQTLDTVTDDNQKLSDDKFRLQQTLGMKNDDYSRLEKGVSILEHENAHLTRQLFLCKVFLLVFIFILAAFNFGSLQQYASS